jgi:hypothetical protein
VSFPKDLLTWVNACLVYYLQPTELWWQFNFSVLVRKAKFIHIHITDPVQRKLSDRWGLLVGIGLGIFFLLVINRKKK